MTYIQKKRIKLILLGLGVFALWIYLLGVMTAHAKWVQINDIEYAQVHMFYYENASVKINSSTGIVQFDLIFHFTKAGAKQFVIENKLDPKTYANFTYAINTVEFNYKKNEWRVIGMASSYDNNKKLIQINPPADPPPFKPIVRDTLAEAWCNQIRKDYGL